MIDFMIAIFIFIGVIAVTTLLFSGWAVYGVTRAIVSGISALLTPGRSARQGSPEIGAAGSGRGRCPQPRCQAENPPGAQFCRRCGVSLAAEAEDVSRRRAPFGGESAARTAQRIAL